MLYWLYKHIVFGPWLRVFFRPIVEGLENVPEDGAAILASNHPSFCDSIFLPLVVHRKVTFTAKQEYFTGKGIKGFFSRLFFVGAGQIPIDRTSGSAARDALETGKKVLAAGELLGWYPEGTRSPDGRLYRGKTGVARVALESMVPVIPCAMLNTHEIQPLGKRFPRLLIRPRMRIGAPLDFTRYEGMAGDRFVERSMTDEIMYQLMMLTGREYVDVYASKIKAMEERSKRAAKRQSGDSAAA